MSEPTSGRRRFIRQAITGSAALGVGAGLPLATASAAALASAPATTATPPNAAATASSPGYLFLRPAEADFVEALVDHMVPADALSPSGTGLNINIYFDRALGGNWGAGDRLYTEGPWHVGVPSQGYQLPLTPAELFRAGVEGTDRYADKTYGVPFARLSPANKDALLHSLEAGHAVFDNRLDSAIVFGLFYQLVTEGMFADPIHGGNAGKAAWQMIGFPGVIATHAQDVVQFKNKRYVSPATSIADLA
ncbi:MAG: gluconate 2-dehydrogenase subunit 3 family protein [Janthinobacterium lividum]